jgi:PadR family transcriptional regulator PadR
MRDHVVRASLPSTRFKRLVPVKPRVEMGFVDRVLTFLPYLELRGIMAEMTSKETNPNFMNGVPELLVLRLLEDAEMYGYEIVQAIRDRTDAVIVVGEGVVYPALHSLERAGALKSRRKTVAGRSRIYYSMRKAGSRRLAELAAQWMSLAGAIQKTLAGGQYGNMVA